MSKTQHTPGAMRAAAIIMGDDASIWTVYGRKTLVGLADLIDIETAAPDLLAACEALLAVCPTFAPTGSNLATIEAARAAIARARGEA